MRLLPKIFRPAQRTPSLEYKPQTKVDKRDAAYYRSIRAFRDQTGFIHPDIPMQPAGRRLMTPDEAAATLIFRDHHDRVDDPQVEYLQTYRREGGEIVANQDQLIRGGHVHVDNVPGLYPPGSRIDIHSHPDVDRPLNAVPSDADYLHAQQVRTNALHREGTEMTGGIMYYPPTRTFFGYTGERVGPGMRPEFHELIPRPGDTSKPLPPIPDPGPSASIASWDSLSASDGHSTDPSSGHAESGH
ncbi:MAG: hypothetical protein JWP91_3718 [Fibrobacteres bacterium]|nr:hypothetical protein [Fibrobacterota bacterium]